MHQTDPDSVALNTYGERSDGLKESLFNLVFATYPHQYKAVVSESHAKLAQYLAIAEQLPAPKADGQSIRVLEVGPSNSTLLLDAINNLGRNVANYSLMGIDKFAPMINTGTSVQMVQASVNDLPLTAASVDAVVISSVLLYVTDRSGALDEVRRVLKPGGRLILTELDAEVGVDGLLGNILKEELACISMSISQKFPSLECDSVEFKSRFIFGVVKHFGPKIRLILGSLLRNKIIVKESTPLEGFTKKELFSLLTSAGLAVDDATYEKVYANAYHLLVACKSES